MHTSIRLTFLALGLFFFAAAPAIGAKLPNIVFILADDK